MMRTCRTGLPNEAVISQAVTKADALLLLTEGQENRDLDPYEFIETVIPPRMLDGMSVLEANKWRAAGFNYRRPGRP